MQVSSILHFNGGCERTYSFHGPAAGSSAKSNKKKAKKGGAAAAATPDGTSAAAATTSSAEPLSLDAAASAVAAGELVYGEFNPLPLLPYKDMPYLDLPSFDEALDEFYSKIEGQRADIARAEAERNAMSRLDKIKADQVRQRVR